MPALGRAEVIEKRGGAEGDAIHRTSIPEKGAARAPCRPDESGRQKGGCQRQSPRRNGYASSRGDRGKGGVVSPAPSAGSLPNGRYCDGTVLRGGPTRRNMARTPSDIGMFWAARTAHIIFWTARFRAGARDLGLLCLSACVGISVSFVLAYCTVRTEGPLPGSSLLRTCERSAAHCILSAGLRTALIPAPPSRSSASGTRPA